MIAMKLKEEYETYKTHKEDLLSKHDGKFVLIKGSKIIDFFSSYDDALKEGFKKFGNVPFLVKQIQKEEEVNFFYSNVAA